MIYKLPWPAGQLVTKKAMSSVFMVIWISSCLTAAFLHCLVIALFYTVVSCVYYFSHIMNFCCNLMPPEWFRFRRNGMCWDTLVPRPQITLSSKGWENARVPETSAGRSFWLCFPFCLSGASRSSKRRPSGSSIGFQCPSHPILRPSLPHDRDASASPPL